METDVVGRSRGRAVVFGRSHGLWRRDRSRLCVVPAFFQGRLRCFRGRRPRNSRVGHPCKRQHVPFECGTLSSPHLIRPSDPPRRHDRSHGGGLPGATPRGHRPDRREAARASLAGYPLTGQIGPASVLAVLKLILHPILA